MDHKEGGPTVDYRGVRRLRPTSDWRSTCGHKRDHGVSLWNFFLHYSSHQDDYVFLDSGHSYLRHTDTTLPLTKELWDHSTFTSPLPLSLTHPSVGVVRLSPSLGTGSQGKPKKFWSLLKLFTSPPRIYGGRLGQDTRRDNTGVPRFTVTESGVLGCPKNPPLSEPEVPTSPWTLRHKNSSRRQSPRPSSLRVETYHILSRNPIDVVPYDQNSQFISCYVVGLFVPGLKVFPVSSDPRTPDPGVLNGLTKDRKGCLRFCALERK